MCERGPGVCELYSASKWSNIKMNISLDWCFHIGICKSCQSDTDIHKNQGQREHLCLAKYQQRNVHVPLSRYANLLVAHAPGMPGTFFPPPRVSDPDMHNGPCVTHVPWCMPGPLTSGFLLSWWRGKRSRHSRRMRNQQFCVSGKRPIGKTAWMYYDTIPRIFRIGMLYVYWT